MTRFAILGVNFSILDARKNVVRFVHPDVADIGVPRRYEMRASMGLAGRHEMGSCK